MSVFVRSDVTSTGGSIAANYILAERCITRRDIERFIMERMMMSEDERVAISSAPQRSPLWLRGRFGGITGTRSGKVLERFSGYKRGAGEPWVRPKDALLQEMLDEDGNHEPPQNHYMWLGTVLEPIGTNVYSRARKQQRARAGIDHQFSPSGLVVHPWKPWLKYSPDGLFKESVARTKAVARRGLFEHKIVAQTILDPSQKPPRERRPAYEDQIQFGMYVCEFLPGQQPAPLTCTDFCYFTPTKLYVERVESAPESHMSWFIDKLDTFWFQEFAPLAVAKQNGWLADGSITMPMDVVVEDFDYREVVQSLHRAWHELQFVPKLLTPPK